VCVALHMLSQYTFCRYKRAYILWIMYWDFSNGYTSLADVHIIELTIGNALDEIRVLYWHGVHW